MIVKLLICILAGMGAGLGTGFAGMSAAAVISPMLITFLGMDPYMAVGIALASDVLASAASAVTYGRNKNLDIKNGIIMMISVLCFTTVGSWIASIVPKTTMGNFSVFMTLLLGVKFIVKPVVEPKKRLESATAKQKAIRSVICGINWNRDTNTYPILGENPRLTILSIISEGFVVRTSTQKAKIIFNTLIAISAANIKPSL